VEIFETLEWNESRILAADMEKAHAVSGNNRFLEDGSLTNKGVLHCRPSIQEMDALRPRTMGRIIGRQMYSRPYETICFLLRFEIRRAGCAHSSALGQQRLHGVPD